MLRRIPRSWESSSHIGGWIDIEPKAVDQARISYRYKVDDQARFVWYPMSIDYKLSSSVLIYI